METDINTVAVIGIGEIGLPMSRWVRKSGYDVRVFDVDDDAVAPLRDEDIVVTSSPTEAAKHADCSILILGNEGQIWDVLRGTDEYGGLLDEAERDHIVVVSSTITEMACQEIEQYVETRGGHVVDAPVIRGPKAAEDGTLLISIGGRDDQVELVRPVLESFARPSDVVHVGDLGSGSVAKTANNSILWANLQANYEALTLAESYGMDVTQLQQFLVKGSADNWALREWDWVPYHAKWADKDMKIKIDMAQQKDIALPLAGLVRELMRGLDRDEVPRVAEDE